EAARLGRDLVDQVTRKGGSAPLPTGGAVLAARTRAASPSKARAKPAHEHRRGLSPPPSLPEQQIAPAEPALAGAGSCGGGLSSGPQLLRSAPESEGPNAPFLRARQSENVPREPLVELSAAFLRELEAIVGARGVVSSYEGRLTYEADMHTFYKGAPDVVTL